MRALIAITAAVLGAIAAAVGLLAAFQSSEGARLPNDCHRSVRLVATPAIAHPNERVVLTLAGTVDEGVGGSPAVLDQDEHGKWVARWLIGLGRTPFGKALRDVPFKAGPTAGVGVAIPRS